ncbi:MAG: DUF3090 family protein, partial [Chloroflexi bacterium]|nr:DUF3090 family protein [Chloroflexota bacterium]
MAEAQHDLGLVTRLHTEALGTPGQRRFRILAEGERGSAVVWLEKEELHSLALAIARLLEILAEEMPLRRSQPPPEPGPAPRTPPLEFQAG